MKLGGVLAVLLLAAAAGGQDVCPKWCKCKSNIARCSELDSATQRFSGDISSLVVRDLTPRLSKFVLGNKMLAELGLQHVRTVQILNSSLRAVDAEAFRDLELVSDVDLSDNRLVDIPPDVFIDALALRRLRLKGNPISLPQEGAFLRSDHLTEMDLSHAEVFQLPHRTFSALPNLETLILSHNKIREMDAEVLKPLYYLESLDLSYNQIQYISPDTFVDTDEMTALNLRGNPIKSLQELNLPDLKELDVSHCRLKGLFSDSLEGVPQLSTLNLTGNAIETIDADAFGSLLDLMYLYLSGNDLRGPLPEYLFEHNTQLEILSLSGNPKLEKFDGFTSEFVELYFLDISHCGLKEISNRSFNGMYMIATLNASGNHLQHIDFKTFSKLKRLTVLDLSDNGLHYLPIKIFANNAILQKLYVGDNQLHHLPAAVFSTTPGLYSLDARNNRLGYLWNVSESVIMRSTGVLKDLVYLNVAGNRLKKLHLQNFISLKKLGQLDISDNPIECSAGFGHVVEWLVLHRVLPNRGGGQHPVSVSDELYNNVQWDETLKSVCPKTTGTGTGTGEPVTERKTYIPLEGEPQLEKLSVASSDIPEPDTMEYIKMEENKYMWPLVLVAFAALSLVLALGNIAFLVLYKARKYRVISNKSHYPNPLAGLSQIRHKNAHVYQKLYEDCSVPKTPIVKNTQGKFHVTVITDSDKAEAV